MANANTGWLVNAIFNYLQVHKGRVERKEISTATLRNYVKPIRLYCEQMDIPVPWKKLLRGMPKGRRYANDRAPTLDEIRRVLAYPDRRIRSIVCVMTSSGIRLSAWNYLKWKHIIPDTFNMSIAIQAVAWISLGSGIFVLLVMKETRMVSSVMRK
jgi:integrase